MVNYLEMNVKMRRIDVCDLLIACDVLEEISGATKWGRLHDMLETYLDEFDSSKEIKKC